MQTDHATWKCSECGTLFLDEDLEYGMRRIRSASIIEKRRAVRTRAVIKRIKDLQVAAGTRLPKDGR